MMKNKVFPFTGIPGQERMKEALILNLINPSIGGVLIRGEKGTAKTTAVRGLAEVFAPLKVVELPMNATEDRVAGTLDLEHMLSTGEQKFEPGLLMEADGQILYVDEINLLEDHIVNLLLDAAATGTNTVEREGISVTHSSRFVLVGTMNPEEGSLRPQLLDRFGMVVDVEGEKDPALRVEIMERRLAYEKDPEKFCRKYARSRNELKKRILLAKENLDQVTISKELLLQAAEICIQLGVQGHRADITMIKTAKTLAAYHGNPAVTEEELKSAAAYVLPHRMRRSPLEQGKLDEKVLEDLFEKQKQRSRETTPKKNAKGSDSDPG